jgi:phenylalanyl-tRNA synthetase beta chain
MILSRKFIERYLPLNEVTDQEFIKAVSSTGNELPNKDIYKHPKLNNLVVGEIISHKPLEGTHLNYCDVKIDAKGTIKKIVCGAPNVTDGKKVIVALEGAKLFDGRVIENKELRGVKSEGMLCAYYELTPLNEKFISKSDSDGIILLNDDEAKIGDTKVAELLGLDDTIYEIEVPFSNRHDIEATLVYLQDIAAYFK